MKLNRTLLIAVAAFAAGWVVGVAIAPRHEDQRRPAPADTNLSDLLIPLDAIPAHPQHIPRTERDGATDILTGPRGGRFWITSGGGKHYTKVRD